MVLSKMTLIADSGSTKTTWMVAETGNKIVTEGLNPHFTSNELFLTACETVVKDLTTETAPKSLFFYGAGCGNKEQSGRVKQLLATAFGIDDVHVETDMLGACRAVCGNHDGLVGILGTGSNACYYDGKEIALRCPSTGYILGDEGSANHVGRRLLQDYLTGNMPRNMATRFHEAYPMTHDEFMDAVYHQPNPNRFLASLAQFALKNINDDYCSSEILVSLYDWYNYQLDNVCTLSRCRELNLVGGFAARIKPLIEVIANDHGLTIKNVVADPIEGLTAYHASFA